MSSQLPPIPNISEIAPEPTDIGLDNIETGLDNLDLNPNPDQQNNLIENRNQLATRIKSLDEDSTSVCSNTNSKLSVGDIAYHNQNSELAHQNITSLIQRHSSHLDSGNNSNDNLSDSNSAVHNHNIRSGLSNGVHGEHGVLQQDPGSGSGHEDERFATLSPLSPDAAFNLKLRLAQVRADRDSLQLCLKQTHHALKLIQLDHSITQTENSKLKNEKEALEGELEEEKGKNREQAKEIAHLKEALRAALVKNEGNEKHESCRKPPDPGSGGGTNGGQSITTTSDRSDENAKKVNDLQHKLEQTELKYRNAERRQASYLASANAAKSEVRNLQYLLEESKNESEANRKPTNMNTTNMTNTNETETQNELNRLKEENKTLITAFENHQNVSIKSTNMIRALRGKNGKLIEELNEVKLENRNLLTEKENWSKQTYQANNDESNAIRKDDTRENRKENLKKKAKNLRKHRDSSPTKTPRKSRSPEKSASNSIAINCHLTSTEISKTELIKNYMDCQTQLVGYGYYNGYGPHGSHSPKLVRSYSLDRLNIEDPTSQNSEDDFNTIKDYKNSIQQLNYAREVQNKVVSKLKNVKLEVADNYLSTEVDGSKNCFKQYKQIGTQYNVESVSRYCGTNVAISNRICEVGSQVELKSTERKCEENTSSTQTDPVSRRNSDVKLKIQRPESQHNIDTTVQGESDATSRTRHRSAFTISAVLDQTNIEKCDTSSQTSDTPQVKEIIKEVFIEKIQQVPVEVIKKIEVPVEVIKEVPVNIIKEVPIEKIKIIKVPYVDKIKEQEHENNIKITKEALFKLQANEQILSAYSHAVQVLTAKLNNWEQGQFETISRTISGDSEGEDTLTGEQVEEVKKDTKLEISTVQVAEIEQALEKAAKPAVLKKIEN